MLPSQLNVSPGRANAFARDSVSPGPASPTKHVRAKSSIVGSTSELDQFKGHTRNSSISQLSQRMSAVPGSRDGSNSARNNVSSGTFAPEFIKSEELRRGADQIRGLEGDNDFSGNKYVWLRDSEKAFVRGLVVEEKQGGRLLVQGDDGDVRIKMNWDHGTDELSDGKLTRIKSTK